MGGFLGDLMKLFGFAGNHSVIGVISLLFFLLSFFGGLVAGMATAFGGPQPPRKLSDQLSARLMLLVEIILILWILFYHLFLIENVTASHAVYWISTLACGPILGLVGLEITSSVFASKIRDNEKLYRIYKRKQMSDRAKEREAQFSADQKAGAALAAKLRNN